MIDTPSAPRARTPVERREWRIFVLIALVILATGIGLRDPWPSDEPRFALVAKQMVESGDWLFTHRGSELYSDKPPLFMQMQAAAWVLTGNWRIAFLLPSLLAALGTLFLVYDLGRRLWDHRTGLWAAIALLATVQFVYQSKRAQIDPLVTFFITLANWGLLRHFLLGPNWRAYWLGCFAAGLGVISKGVGALALLMFIPYLVARRRGWQPVFVGTRNGWRWAGGALAFLAAIGIWIVPMLIVVLGDGTPAQHAYMHDILFRQTAGRYTDSWAHRQPPWYFLEVVATSWLPLAFALLPALPRWRERLAARDARFLLPLAWIALLFVFFTIPSGKRDVYILPALPWVALMLAPFLDGIVARPWFRRLILAFVAFLAVALLALGSAALLGKLPAAAALAEQRGLANGGTTLWVMLVVIGAFAALAALVFRVRRSLVALAVTLATLWLAWSLWAYPVLNDSSTGAAVMRRADALVGADGEMALVAWKEQNLLFAVRPPAEFGFRQPWHAQLGSAIRWQEADPDRRHVFILDHAMGTCIDRARAIELGNANRRTWWLFRADAVRPACRGGNVPVVPDYDEDAAD